MSWISALLFGPSDDLSDVALNIKRDEPERRVIDTKITRLEEGYRCSLLARIISYIGERQTS